MPFRFRFFDHASRVMLFLPVSWAAGCLDNTNDFTHNAYYSTNGALASLDIPCPPAILRADLDLAGGEAAWQQNEKPYVVGVDLGGTNVRAAVIDRASEQIVARGENISSRGMEGPDLTAMQIALAAKTALEQAGADADAGAGRRRRRAGPCQGQRGPGQVGAELQRPVEGRAHRRPDRKPSGPAGADRQRRQSGRAGRVPLRRGPGRAAHGYDDARDGHRRRHHRGRQAAGRRGRRRGRDRPHGRQPRRARRQQRVRLGGGRRRRSARIVERAARKIQEGFPTSLARAGGL